eukprot:1376015-Pyramimonas_sp.AAC.1
MIDCPPQAPSGLVVGGNRVRRGMLERAQRRRREFLMGACAGISCPSPPRCPPRQSRPRPGSRDAAGTGPAVDGDAAS